MQKYDDEMNQQKKAEDEYIKQKYEQYREKLKYKRINEDEPYEDGDNFDDHVGKLQVITNPYEFLKKEPTKDQSDQSEEKSESEEE